MFSLSTRTHSVIHSFRKKYSIWPDCLKVAEVLGMMCGAYAAVPETRLQPSASLTDSNQLSPKLQHEFKIPHQLNISDPNSWDVALIVDSIKELVTVLNDASFTSMHLFDLLSLRQSLVSQHRLASCFAIFGLSRISRL
jgi:hypothetical protein